METDSLNILRRQYYALYPVYLLSLPPPAILVGKESQKYLVSRILNDTQLGEFQPETGYRRLFWRKILVILEEGVREVFDEIEVDERIYETVAKLMVSELGSSFGSCSIPKASYKTFIYDRPSWASNPGQEGRITLVEEQVAVQAGTTGLRTWTASLFLAHYILRHPEILIPPSSAQKSPTTFTESINQLNLPLIMELGAGTGFLSILLSQLGADVISTDLGDEPKDPVGQCPNDTSRLNSIFQTDDQEEVLMNVKQTPLDRLKGNIALNGLDCPPKVLALDWMSYLRPMLPGPQDFFLSASWTTGTPKPSGMRTIVAADVIYDPDLIPALVATIHHLLTSLNPSYNDDNIEHGNQLDPCGIAIIAATIRNESTFQSFLETCYQRGLSTCLIDTSEEEGHTFWDSALDRGTRVEILRIEVREPSG